jgi:hypothetical protein
MVLSKDKVGQGLGALCGSILQPKAWCLVLWWVLCGCGAGLSYNQRLSYGAVVGVVRVYLTSKL